MNEEKISESLYPDYKNEIAELVKSKLSDDEVRDKLLDYHENDIAAALEYLESHERLRLYRVLDIDTLSAVFEYADDLYEYLDELGIRKKVDVLSRIETSDAVEYLEGLERDQLNTIVDMLDEEPKKDIAMISLFEKDEIGSKMTTNFISVTSDTDIRGTMTQLVSQAAENDNVSTIYVTDENGAFVGAIDLKDLIIARAGQPLDSIIRTSYPYVYAHDLIEDCIERLSSYSEDSIPVLDSENKLSGVLTAQELAQMIGEEIGDDYAKLGGLTEAEELDEPLKKSISKRLPWLVVLFGLGIIVSSVVGLFEEVAAHITVIVSFQSLILGMAGNVGTQSLAVTIRMLMDEDISGKKSFYFIMKEARVGFFNGLILGVISFAVIGLYLFAKSGDTIVAFSVSFCTGAALLVSMLLASVSGSAIPMIFKKCKIDPAVASGPFITTVNDLVAVISYYGLAWLLLINFLNI
ncbi:MAG: magnesium transporter [Ruminococcaceae bacterium]|nr:magnesium transporter [Oscillospiraceae bacterium]